MKYLPKIGSIIRKNSLKRNNFKKDSSNIKLVLITSILTAMSTLGVTYFAYYLSRSKDEETFLKNKVFDYQMYILNERKTLLERTNQILYKRKWFYNLEVIVDASQQLAQLNASSSVGQFDKHMNNLSSSTKELNELVAEYSSLMTLNQIYFGPKTNKCVHKLNMDSVYWWHKDRILMDSLIFSMQEEMFYQVIPLSKFNEEWL
jgi:hypothetical protein